MSWNLCHPLRERFAKIAGDPKCSCKRWELLRVDEPEREEHDRYLNRSLEGPCFTTDVSAEVLIKIDGEEKPEGRIDRDPAVIKRITRGDQFPEHALFRGSHWYVLVASVLACADAAATGEAIFLSLDDSAWYPIEPTPAYAERLTFYLRFSAASLAPEPQVQARSRPFEP